MKPSEYAESMLKALVKIHDLCPALGIDDPTILPTKWELAHRAGIILAREEELAEKYAVTLNSCLLPQTSTEQQQVRRLTGIAGNLDAAMHEMKTRGWAFTWEDRAWPTNDGLDYARFLMRPWYRKMWDFFKGDVRTIIIAVIAAVVITIVTNLIMRLLGWH